MSKNEEKISMIELLGECLYIYDYNYEALVLHVYTFLKKAGRTQEKKKIMEDFKNKETLEKYRMFLEIVMDTHMEDIKYYKDMIDFNISGSHAPLLYCYENIAFIDNLTIKQKNKMERELVDITFYAEHLLNKLKEAKNG